MASVLFQNASCHDNGSWHGNVVLNFTKWPDEEFPILAEAYHEAAKKLVQGLASSSGYSDYEACPILFLYRHSLELYIKAIVYKGASLVGLISDDRIDYERAFGRHRLGPLLPALRVIWRHMRWNWDFGVDYLQTFEDFENLVKEIESIDPDSYAFRYPVNKQFQANLPDHFRCNVILVGRRLDPVLAQLNGAVTGIEARWEHVAEMVHEAEQILRDAL